MKYKIRFSGGKLSGKKTSIQIPQEKMIDYDQSVLVKHEDEEYVIEGDDRRKVVESGADEYVAEFRGVAAPHQTYDRHFQCPYCKKVMDKTSGRSRSGPKDGDMLLCIECGNSFIKVGDEGSSVRMLSDEEIRDPRIQDVQKSFRAEKERLTCLFREFKRKDVDKVIKQCYSDIQSVELDGVKTLAWPLLITTTPEKLERLGKTIMDYGGEIVQHRRFTFMVGWMIEKDEEPINALKRLFKLDEENDWTVEILRFGKNTDDAKEFNLVKLNSACITWEGSNSPQIQGSQVDDVQIAEIEKD